MTVDGATAAFTNTMTQRYDRLKVLKVFDDEDDRDHLRPVSVTVKVSTQEGTIGTYVLSAENEWTVELEDLPRYADNGETLKYVVEEVDVPEGYTVQYTSRGRTITITNKHRHIDGTLTINDYDIPLAAGINMNEGDCFD